MNFSPYLSVTFETLIHACLLVGAEVDLGVRNAFKANLNYSRIQIVDVSC